MSESKSSEIVVRRQQPPHRQWWLLGCAVVLVATAGGVYWGRFHRSTVQLQAGAHIWPEKTIAAFTLATDRSQWQQLRQLGTPQSRAVLEQAIAQWQQEIFTKNGYDFDRNIQPWLGSEISVAYLAALTPQAAPVPLVLLSIDAATTPQQVADQLKATAAARSKVVERSYQGRKIIETTFNNKTVVHAIFERWVLSSPSAKAIEQSIDALQAKKTLAQSAGFSQAMGEIGTVQPIAQIYVNIPLATKGQIGTAPLAAEKLAQVQQQQGLAASFSLSGNLLTSKGIAWWRPDSTIKLAPSTTSPPVAALVPASAVLMLSGHNLAQLWQDYLPLATNNPWAPLQPETLRASLQSATGLDLAADVLAWSNSEFGAAIVPPAADGKSLLGGSLLLMVKSTDRQATETTLANLDKTMASRYQFQVAKAQTNNVAVTNWSSPLGGINATHGWLADRWAFLALGDPLPAQFLPQPSAPLANSQEFQQVMQSEIAPHGGQFYLHLHKMQQANNDLLAQLPPTSQAILGAVQSIGLTSNATSTTTNRFDLSVALKQVAGQLTPSSPVPSRQPQ